MKGVKRFLWDVKVTGEFILKTRMQEKMRVELCGHEAC